MELHLTLIDPQRTGAGTDVALEAPAGTPVGTLIRQLASLLGTATPIPAVTGELPVRCGVVLVHPEDPLGLPPLLHGCVLTFLTGNAGPQSPGPTLPPDGLLQAQVLAGPDAGGVFPLRPGRQTIGRSAGNSIRISDAEISRVHAELTLNAGQVTVSDAGSTNGTWLGGRPVGADEVPLPPGRTVTLGGSVIAVRAPDRPPAAVAPDGEGHLVINRSPRLRAARTHSEVGFPAAPAPVAAPRLSWPAMLLPLLLAAATALFWRQPGFLLFAVTAPLMLAGQHAAERRAAKREAARRRADYQTARAESQIALDRALATDLEYLGSIRPDLARLAVAARIPTDDLWPRVPADAEFLLLRLGRGTEPAAVVVDRPTGDPAQSGTPPPGPVIHPEAPVAISLSEVRVLGLCGPRPEVLGLARSLIGQISILHSPNDVRLEVITADPGNRHEWRWLAWLPHHDQNPAGSHRSQLSRRVIILDGAHALRGRPEVAAALHRAAKPGPATSFAEVTGLAAGAEGPDPPPLLICLDRNEQGLPLECRATITLDPAGPAPAEPGRPRGSAERTALLRRDRAPAGWFAPDLASAHWAERIGRQLAPLRDAGPDPAQALPDTVRLLDLITDTDRVRPTDPVDLARHWRRNPPPRPVATLGVSTTGAFRIDLRRDGPHLLIGGTTGAGKSELLQSLVVALAVNSAPDAISFLLIDYKGGAALRECAALAHVGGVITDLDPYLARRALTSLTAELRRRERLLGAVRVADIDAYGAVRARRDDVPALPRLVVLVDEFRVLAEELPEFVHGLIRVATVGRALGVHLVLATQRPAGIVSAEITANVNLRIALRVRDGSDSRDLIEDPAAAHLPADRPGRALARSGPDPMVLFQTARVCGPAAELPAPAIVRRLDWAEATSTDPAPAPASEPPMPAPDREPGGQTDLVTIAAAVRRAAAQLGLTPVPPPWLPPLPGLLPLTDLLAGFQAPDPGPDSAVRFRLPFGRIDLPDEQRQEPVAWRSGAHLAVTGGPRSGRTTVLRTLAQAAAVVLPPDSHLYLIDSTGALSDLKDLPVVEAVVAGSDTERAQRLLERLTAEIARRQGFPDPAFPVVILLIDGWETLIDGWNEVDHGRMVDHLIAVLRDGLAVGVQAAISGGRSLLTGAISSLSAERVVLRFADATDSMLAGVPTALAGRPHCPGRGVYLAPDRPEPGEVQVAMPPTSAMPLISTIGRSSVPGGGGNGDRQRWGVPELPQRLEHQQLLNAWRERTPAPAGPRERRGLVPIGLGGEDVLPLALDLEASPVTLVLGTRGSGRTTTLRCLADGLRQLGERVLMLSPAERGPGSRPPVAAELARTLSEFPDTTVLVDDVSSADPWGGSPDEAIGERLAAHVPPGRLIIACSAADVLSAYRGLPALARTARSGLLLGRPGPGDGEVFGLRLGYRPPGPPGRALLVQAGKVSTVQLALPLTADFVTQSAQPQTSRHCPVKEWKHDL